MLVLCGFGNFVCLCIWVCDGGTGVSMLDVNSAFFFLLSEPTKCKTKLDFAVNLMF